MSLSGLTEAVIRQNAEPNSFARGREYFQDGAVSELTLRGDILQAEVEGSDIEPYQVTVTLDASGIVEADCTCPYDWGGWCKHIVATLLAVLNAPELLEEKPPLETLLASLDREQLQALLLKLARRQPGLIAAVEAELEG
jgi:uncharacterized Zn finger protein